MPSFASDNPARTKHSAPLLFLLTAVWIAVASSLSGILLHLLPASGDWVSAALSLIVLFSGFYGLARRMIRDRRPLSSVGFVRRPTAAAELALGAALGWGVAIALVAPQLLFGSLQITFDGSTEAWHQTGTSMLLLAMEALLAQLVLAGLPFRALVESVGAAPATVLVMLMTGAWSLHALPGRGSPAVLLAFYALIGCIGWLRTRAIWLPLGMHLALFLSLALLFGSPVPGGQSLPGILTASFSGPAWLSGGGLGSWASSVAAAVLLLLWAVLLRVTRDYAWHYTYQPIVGAGYATDIAPPPEHARMEAAAAAQPVPLVQIMPSAANAPNENQP